jgi:hypothetical protein
LESDPEKAASELAAASNGLHHLLSYYLPLLEARELTQNAFRHLELGRIGQTDQELDKVESLLLAVAESDQGRLLREMEEPLAALNKARAAVGVDPGEAAAALRDLSTRLNSLLVKGGLVLAE